MLRQKKQAGFTLIELLIVVAIIAILAAIAVPNFLEAQVRSKVSRVRNDMRSIDLALNSYFVDVNRFPPDVYGRSDGMMIPPDNLKYYMVSNVLFPLTTPIAYMTSVSFGDPFSRGGDPNAPFSWDNITSFQYYDLSNPFSWGTLAAQYDDVASGRNNIKDTTARLFPSALLVSMGPDTRLSQGEWAFIPTANDLNHEGKSYIYDPTNGTVSDGDIVRGIGLLHGAPTK